MWHCHISYFINKEAIQNCLKYFAISFLMTTFALAN